MPRAERFLVTDIQDDDTLFHQRFDFTGGVRFQDRYAAQDPGASLVDFAHVLVIGWVSRETFQGTLDKFLLTLRICQFVGSSFMSDG
jgi:hypothetical protein